ncbi:MAG: DEAD/DEAH box helicase [Cyanobacteria bacterium J06650_10]
MPDVAAPGARIICRDAEWLVKSSCLSSTGDRVIEAIGVSEFIKGKSARFLQDLEQSNLQILLPEETALVSDGSPGYRHSLLFLEAQLKQTSPDDGRIYTGNQAAMDLLPYQLQPAYDALQRPRQRILIADAVGLGKTLECGILASELIRRGRGRRILVVTTKAMLTQFQKEFWARFTIPLVPLDSTTIQRIRTRIPGNHNPFHYYDRTIISVDTLKQDREYRSYLEDAHWDIIIIDEAHNVARRGHGASQRARLAKRLSTCSDTLILLSATPHDGRPASFASLMNMLDATAIADETDYTKEDIRNLYIRRFKKDVLQDLKQHVPEREVEAVEAQASRAEERIFECLNALKFFSIDSRRSAGHLFKTTLLKAMLSSPAACLATVKNRAKRLAAKSDESEQGFDKGIEQDIEQLAELQTALEQVVVSDFSKYQKLLAVIRQDFGWKGKDAKDRLVIFTGRLDTLKFLKEHLAKDLGLKEKAIASLDGGMADVDQTHIVEAFGQESSPIRILLATEVASEGLNLHYLSHRLIHFEAPWSLMTLQQRNGRIDRYGQTQQPQIRYLLTRSRQSRMDEVERIIKVLLEKDEQAVKNIGDPSVFMGVFDANAEETVTAQAIESGLSASDFSQQLESNAASGGEGSIFDWFEEADAVGEGAESVSPAPVKQPIEQGKLLSLFPSTFEFAQTSLQSLESLPENLSINEAERFIELQLPPELERRYKRLPKQIVPETGILHLTDRPAVMMRAMEAARREEDTWPAKQYLWDLHPLVEWLNDRNLFRFGRHEAPVIDVGEALAPQDAAFVLFGSFPNRRGVPVMSRWLSAMFQAGEFQWVETFDRTVERTGLGTRALPNSGEFSLDELLPLRARAVSEVQRYLQKEHQECEAVLAQKLAEQSARLGKLRDRHLQQLEVRLEADKRPDTFKQQKEQRARSHIERVFKDHQDWVDLSMTTEAQPYIRLAAVLVNNSQK